MAEVIGNPPSLSKQLAKQWKWVAVAVVVIALAIISRNADINIGEATPTGDQCRVEVNADVLNVRAGPGADSASVGQLSRGEVVPAQPELTNGFRKIGDNRWVATEFVTTSGNC
jgi:uncharacterized protein YgiM (DUF1202 family)